MRLFKCFACLDAKNKPGRMFSAATPDCPHCGATETRGIVAPVETIHFDPPSGVPGVGSNDAACNPGLRLGSANVRLTGEPSAVTCPKCMTTDLFKDAAEAAGVPTAHVDFTVVADPVKGLRKDE